MVAVEVVCFLAVFSFFVGPIADLRERFIAARIGVDISIPAAVQVDFLQQMAAVPNEAGLVFEVVPA